jgi:hypothetical protein
MTDVKVIERPAKGYSGIVRSYRMNAVWLIKIIYKS